jgi:hypothetical protein
MTAHRDPHRHVLIVALLISTFLWVASATGVVWSDTLGVGTRLDHLGDRIRLAIDPPPDREIAALVEVTELAPLDTEFSSASTGDVAGPATPRPKRKPVDVKLRAKAGDIFASQHTNDWCSPASIQMVLAMHQASDNSVGFQKKLAGTIKRFESWRDSHNGGWGPASIAEALEAYGVEGYEVRAYGNRALALRDSARALSITKAPVILIAWRGAHTWVMTGYRATADPTVFRDAKITGAYIYDPWYPRVSSIWGASDKPGTFQDAAEMERNFLRWDRPEGNYKDRDGKFLAVVPTIPLKDQPSARP